MGHYDELAALCQAIRDDTDPPMTIEHGRHVLQVEKAIFEAIATGRVVDYPAFLSRWKTRQPAELDSRGGAPARPQARQAAAP
jgi:hypothetical protein